MPSFTDRSGAAVRRTGRAAAILAAGVLCAPGLALGARAPQAVQVTAGPAAQTRVALIAGGLLLAVAFGLLAARAAPARFRAASARATSAATAADIPGPPALAAGVELLGPMEGSGYRQQRFLARLGDGRMIALTGLAYAVLAQIDGRRDAEAIANEASAAVGRRMGADDVRFLMRERLRPAGLLEGGAVAARPARPVLSLMTRAAIVPGRPVQAAAEALRHLFRPWVVATVLGAFAALDAWVVAVHGAGAGLRATLQRPGAMLLVLGLLLASGAFHELGHAAACRYGGARPGAVGIGIYLIWPVFYNDISDSYRLGRAGRLRTDLGGLYFNAVFVLLAAGAYLAGGPEALLAFVVVQQLQMAMQFMPWVRLDGYYVVSDLAGVPNLFGQVATTLRGLLPGAAAARGRRLTRRARAIVRGWVLTAVALLAVVAGLLVLQAPGVVAAERASWRRAVTAVGAATAAGDPAAVAAAVAAFVPLVIPLVGLTLVAAVLARRLAGAAAGRWTRLPRVALVALACFVAGLVVPLAIDTVPA